MTDLRVGLRNVGPVVSADVELSDFNLFVGENESGKGLFSQIIRLIFDKDYILPQMRRHGIGWRDGDFSSFLDAYLGAGMGRIWDSSRSKILIDGREHNPRQLLNVDAERDSPSVIYIPAHRSYALSTGYPRTFQDLPPNTGFALRDFSSLLHKILSDLRQRTAGDTIFPPLSSQTLPRSGYLELLMQNLFAGARLRVVQQAGEDQLALETPDGALIPPSAWTASQTQFVPMLLAIYPALFPPEDDKQAMPRWLIAEKPELALHDTALGAALLTLLEALGRGVKVISSTHSSDIVSLVWLIETVQRHNAPINLLFRALGSSADRSLGKTIARKECSVYDFPRNGVCRNISDLSASLNEDDHERMWGGTELLASRMNDAVADAVCFAQNREARPKRSKSRGCSL